VKVEELFVHASEWRQPGHPGVRENHINLSIVSLDHVVKMIEVAQAGDIASDSGSLFTNFSNGRIQSRVCGGP
jgi:hypothetical protein